MHIEPDQNLNMDVGIHQGCPLSVAGYNAVLAPLIQQVEQRWPTGHITIYADDVTIHAADKETIQEMATFCGQYFDDLGITINPSKTQYLQLGTLHKVPYTCRIRPFLPTTSICVLGITFWAEGSSMDDDRAVSSLAELQGKAGEVGWASNVTGRQGESAADDHQHQTDLLPMGLHPL